MHDVSRHIDRLSLSFRSVGLPLLLVLAALGVGIAVWYYRDTVPPVAGRLRTVLTALRALALCVLFVGLAEPVVHVVATVMMHDLTAVLLDISSSMDAAGDPARKRDALESLKRLREALNDRAVFYGFDSMLHPLNDGEPNFTGSATDILSAVSEAVSRHDAASVVLVSDGRWNLGENPAGSGLPAGVPVHTVATGSTDRTPETVIKSVSVSPIGHEGERLPVEITVTSTVGSDASVPVVVTEDGSRVGGGTVSFGGGTSARTILDIPLDRPGYHRFTVEIQPEHDRFPDNNRRSFGVTVLKSSFRVLIVAATPSPDLAFIRRAVGSDDSFELDVIVSRGVQGMNDRIDLGSGGYDTVVLLDGGGSTLNGPMVRELAGMVSGGAGLWLVGSTPPADAGAAIGELLPVDFGQRSVPAGGEFTVLPTEQGSTHFVTSGIEDPNRRRDWNELPPLRSLYPVEAKPSGRVLARASGTSPAFNGKPAIVSGRHGSGKVLVMPVSGIWRWRLMLEGSGREGAFFDSFVLGTLRWLTSGAETSPLAVTTDRPTYLSGQEIAFEGRLFDNVYMPVANAEISLVIDDDPAMKVFLRETSPAVYAGTIRGIDPGGHRFTAVAFVGDTRFAETSGTFLVERFSLEMLDTSPDPAVMGEIAANSGGVAVTPAGIDSVLAALPSTLKSERREEDIHPYLNPLFPVIAIALFLVEWTVRKRRGMM